MTVPRLDAAGKLIAVGRSVDPDSQTVMLRALITRNVKNLRPGQRVEATITGMSGDAGNAWRVPREALVRQGKQPLVFLRTGDGVPRAARRRAARERRRLQRRRRIRRGCADRGCRDRRAQGQAAGPRERVIMLERLVEFALTQRLLIGVLTLLLAGLGINALRNLPIDAFPDVSSTQVKIIMKAPGMTPEEVEARIVMPIELEMLGIPHQRMLRSTSKYAHRRRHHRLRRRHRYLLGAPAGLRAPEQHHTGPARHGIRRPRADHDTARRDVHVHDRRWRAQPRPSAAACSTG